jgi:hypothetical protein
MTRRNKLAVVARVAYLQCAVVVAWEIEVTGLMFI